MSIVCVCVTVKIQFDNTKTCKYSIILALRSVVMHPHVFDNTKTCKYSIKLTLHSVVMHPHVFGPPMFKNSASAPDNLLIFRILFADLTNSYYFITTYRRTFRYYL